jgi:hypothetical protein
MNTTKKIVIIVALLILQQTMKAEHIGETFLNRTKQFISGPDYRNNALIAAGLGIVAVGLCLTLIGGKRVADGKPQKESSENAPMIQDVVSDSVARLSGLGTAALGILCTIGGGATIILSKELIIKLESLINQRSS